MPDDYNAQSEHELTKLIDQEAEQAFIGIILAEPKSYDSVAWMKPEYFGVGIHGKIFDAIKSLKIQGREAGPEYLNQFFAQDPELIQAGGEAYLKSLVMDVFYAGAIKDLASRILSLHYRRMVYTVAGQMKDAAIKPEFDMPPEKVLGNVELILAEARNIKTSDNIVSAAEVSSNALQLARNPTYGIKSGFTYLHKITGGFKPSQLIVIGGRPGMGKTALGLTLSVNAAQDGKKVLFFSLEMSRDELMQRVLSRYSRQAIHSGNIDDNEAAESAVEKASKLPLYIDDTAGITALDVSARATSFERRNGLDAVVIDYLGLVKAQDPRANKVHQIEEVTQAFKALAKTLKVPVILLCQLSRPEKGNEAKRPGLSDLRDSGAIEQDADMVMFVYREEYYANNKAEKSEMVSPNRAAAMLADAAATQGKAELIVAKNRQNVLDTVFLKFSGEGQYFHE